MDPKDLEILKLLQSNARLTADTISESVGLSAPAVQKRVKRLRSNGAIEAEIAVLSPKKLGRELTVIVEVTLERESRAHLDAFKQNMRNAPMVQQCYYTTGAADFTLIVVARDIQEYEAFTQTYFFDESNVSRFNTSVVMERVKTSLDII